jgi:glutamyl-tRNA synthetase
MPSTPKHVALYEAFGWEPPKFLHVGLLLNTEKAKLSKRDGSLAISSYRDQGYFPEALSNYLALLGWSHDVHSDVLSREELIEHVRNIPFSTSFELIGIGQFEIHHCEPNCHYAET